MPCESGYLAANEREVYSRETARLICYATGALERSAPRWIGAAARSYYGAPERHDELTRYLCKLVSKLDAADLDRVVYNGRSSMARKLADWWENHQVADAKREAAEAAEAKRQELRLSALAKLTREELAALGVADES